jgi:hypothetical protein
LARCLAALGTHRSKTNEGSVGTSSHTSDDIGQPTTALEPKAPTRHKRISTKAASELRVGR